MVDCVRRNVWVCLVHIMVSDRMRFACEVCNPGVCTYNRSGRMFPAHVVTGYVCALFDLPMVMIGVVVPIHFVLSTPFLDPLDFVIITKAGPW